MTQLHRHLLRSMAAALLFSYAPPSVRAQDDPSLIAAPPGTSPTELGLTELTDDPKPQELFGEVVAAAKNDDPVGFDEGIQYFNLYGPFRFPADTTYDSKLNKPRADAIFGVDISHWTSFAFPIEDLAKRNVTYLYVKATQGTGVDGSFSRFWKRAGLLPKGRQIHRGAYHFLTCGDPSVPAAEWGRSQAGAFLKVVAANGGLKPTDLPPALDLEWDKSATVRDRWSCRHATDVIATAKAFIEEVEAKIHRKPVLYTARSWWRERIGAEASFSAFADNPLWLADYSKSSRASEKPLPIGGVPFAIWQFTDAATLSIGFNGAFDANVFKGSKEDFLKTLETADLE